MELTEITNILQQEYPDKVIVDLSEYESKEHQTYKYLFEQLSQKYEKLIDNSNPKAKAAYSFAQAINHVYDEKTKNVIIDSGTPNYIAIASKENDQLNIEIINKFGLRQKTIQIPIVQEKNQDGFLQIVELQNKYGFSDKVVEFGNIQDARKYVLDSHNRKVSNNQRK